jgi:phosphotransferase system enzyme I (PtsI)
MIELKGLPASPGVAIGKVVIYKRRLDVIVAHDRHVSPSEEISRFFKALEKTKEQILKLREEAVKTVGEKEAAIFDAHLMILEDKEFVDKTVNYIEEKTIPAEKAVKMVSESIIEMFESMANEYFRARADDIRDLVNRILNNLADIKVVELELKEPRIVATSELYPSDTVKMQRQKVIGIITEKGGITSHAAIIARAMKIPAVVGVNGLLQVVKDGDLVIVDGSKGIVLISPEEEIVAKYLNKMGER